jgi:hypothetical protein
MIRPTERVILPPGVEYEVWRTPIERGEQPPKISDFHEASRLRENGCLDLNSRHPSPAIRPNPNHKENVMDILECYPSEYLRAADLKGATPAVTIQTVEKMEVGSSREEKPVLFFEGKGKGLILNKTNSTAIAEMFGRDTENWIGEKVVLFETSVAFQGKVVPAIRIRPAPRGRAAEVAMAAQATTAEIIDDDIPF